nr:hypothetical protein [Endozoicomonas sp.]
MIEVCRLKNDHLRGGFPQGDSTESTEEGGYGGQANEWGEMKRQKLDELSRKINQTSTESGC